MSKGKATEALALEYAHAQTGHHSMCGLSGFDCEACEGAYHAAIGKGRHHILIGLDMADEDAAAEDDHQAMVWAGVYQTYMRGDAPRLELYSWPQTYSDIALIGDAVMSEATSRAYKAASPKSSK